MPPASAEALDGSLSQNGISALFGIQPNSDARIGLSASISNIRIQKGDNIFVNASWESNELDPEVWSVRAQDPGGVFVVESGLAYIFSWDLPDDGYAFSTASNVKGPWTMVDSARLVGAQRMVYMYQSDLPGEDAGFFQLIKSTENP